MIDNFDEIFDLMNRMFKGDNKPTHSTHIDYSQSERQITEDNIYYTILTRNVNKDNLDIKSYEDYIDINISIDTEDHKFKIDLPYKILPKKTEITFINDILDITTYIDKSKVENRVKINEN